MKELVQNRIKRFGLRYHLLHLYNKSLISRRIGDGSMLLFFAIGFAKLAVICSSNVNLK